MIRPRVGTMRIGTPGKRHKGIAILLLTMVLIHFAAGFALAVEDITDVQNELDRQQGSNTQQTNLWWEFVKLMFILMLLIGAAWSVVHLLRNNTAGRVQGTWVHIVDEVALGPNRGIALCEVGGKIYAVGVTDHQVNLLFEVDHPQLLDEISREPVLTRSIPNQSPLANVLNQLLSKSRAKPGASSDFSLMIAEQTKRLQNLKSSTRESGIKVRRNDNHE